MLNDRLHRCRRLRSRMLGYRNSILRFRWSTSMRIRRLGLLIRLGSLTGRLRLVRRRFRSREPRYLQGRITQLAKTISHIL